MQIHIEISKVDGHFFIHIYISYIACNDFSEDH